MVPVGTPSGAVKVNCIKRLPMNQAKDPELLKSIRGYSWRLSHRDVQKRDRRGAHHGVQWAGRART